jgi:hypothetical protein
MKNNDKMYILKRVKLFFFKMLRLILIWFVVYPNQQKARANRERESSEIPYIP